MTIALQSISTNLLLALAGACGIGFIIAFHELGHYLFAKMFNIRVQSFSIGFGPRLLSKKIGETEFALSAIPVGGYVDLSGQEGQPNDPRAFVSKPWYQKFLVMLGGIAFNLLFAYMAFSLLFMAGMPQTPLLYPKNATPRIAAIEANSPAEKAGLKVHDQITKINNLDIASNPALFEQLLNSIRNEFADKEITLEYIRASQPQTTSLKVESKKCLGKVIGSVGISFQLKPLAQTSILQSLKQGIALTNSILINTFDAFKYLLTSCDTTNIAGPVMIFSATMKGAAQGFKIFLLFLAIFSVNFYHIL